jgi:hypothetical protein
MSKAPERIVDGRREYYSRSINQWVPVAGEKVQIGADEKGAEVCVQSSGHAQAGNLGARRKGD